MAIAVDCPECGKSVRVADEKRGKRLKCPGCGEIVHILNEDPDEDAETLPVRRRKSKPRRKQAADKRGGGWTVPVIVGGGILVMGIVVLCVVLLRPAADVRPNVAETAGPPSRGPVRVVVPAAPKNQPVAGNWQTFRHDQGGFSVDVPGSLEKSPNKPGTENLEFYKLKVTGTPTYAIILQHTIFRPEQTAGKDPAFILERTAPVLVNTGTITQRSKVQYEGREGLEVLSPGGASRRSRLFYHRGRVTDFSIIWEGTEPVAERDRIWNSIRFTD